MKLKNKTKQTKLALWKKNYDKSRHHFKSRNITLPMKIHIVKAGFFFVVVCLFPVVLYGCESWTIKKAKHQRRHTVVLEKTLECPLDCKEIKSVNPKGNQCCIFIGRTNAEAAILRPHHAELTHWERPWYWEKRGQPKMRCWMASSAQCTWVRESSGTWWKTGKPSLLQSMSLQSFTQLSDWTTTTISHRHKIMSVRGDW